MLFGMALAYGLGETLTRVFVPDPSFRRENRITMWEEDSLVGFKNKAHLRDYAAGMVRVNTNSLGYRGREVSVEHPPHLFRILGLGDSITWGAGVQDKDTYLRVLEKKLNELASKKGTPGGYETINTGVVGYSTHQELLTLQRDGLPLRPDLVTVGYAHNDFYPTEDPYHNVHTFHQPAKEKVGRHSFYAQPRRVGSHLYWFVRSQVKRAWHHFSRERPLQRAVYPSDHNDWAPDSFEAHAWPVMKDHFRNMKRLGEENGFRLLVILFPTYDQVNLLESSPFPQTRISEFMRAEGIDYIDLFDAFRRAQQVIFVDSIHPNAAGHQLAAEEILRYLENKQWLPE